MIKAEKVSRSFDHKHGRVAAVTDASVLIRKGDFMSIVGPSGSGKSTLILMLGGMSRPSQGQVYWDGQPIYGWSAEQRAKWRATKIGFVFQSFNLVPYLTVLENVAVALTLAGEPEHTALEKARQVLARMKLTDRLSHLPSELSVGQQQRVALARAIAKKPEILFADEPTGNLDPKTGAEVMGILKQLNREGMTIVLISHNPAQAAMAKRKLKISEGRVSGK